MALECLPQTGVCALRVAELDTDGTTLAGSDNLLTVSGVVLATVAFAYTDGVRTTDTDACGSVCLDYTTPDSFVGVDVTLEFCDHNPYIMSALSRGVVLTDGAAIGYGSPVIGAIAGRVSVEFWTQRIDLADLDVDYPYAWHALPRLKNMRMGSRTYSNGSTHPVFTARGIENPNWFDGPTNDWPASSDLAYQWIPTDALPDTACAPTNLAAS